jgi:hypothetical protein
MMAKKSSKSAVTSVAAFAPTYVRLLQNAACISTHSIRLIQRASENETIQPAELLISPSLFHVRANGGQTSQLVKYYLLLAQLITLPD